MVGNPNPKITHNRSSKYPNYFFETHSTASLWKVKWQKNDCDEWLLKEKVTWIKNLPIARRGHLMIEVVDDEYKISDGSDNIFAVYKPEVMKPNSFGFGSVHYSHGCPVFGRFDLKNVSIRVNVVDM